MTKRRRPPLLSVAIIAKNEEEMLPGCLESIRGIADEVVIYDTGSTDNTLQIAEGGGAKVLRGYWDDDFARARNAALRHCRGHWVLSLDADEQVAGDPELARGILGESAVVRSKNLTVALVQVSQPLPGAPIDGGFSAHPRLFRRQGARWIGKLHESPEVDGRSGDGCWFPPAALRIVHRGAHWAYRLDRGKYDRNVHLASLAIQVQERGHGVDEVMLARELACRCLATIERCREGDVDLYRAEQDHQEAIRWMVAACEKGRRRFITAAVISYFLSFCSFGPDNFSLGCLAQLLEGTRGSIEAVVIDFLVAELLSFTDPSHPVVAQRNRLLGRALEWTARAGADDVRMALSELDAYLNPRRPAGEWPGPSEPFARSGYWTCAG